MNIQEFLDMQRKLQIGMKEANPDLVGDPYLMTRDELAEFITWNMTALIKELSEATDEVGWKPWATSRHCNYPAALHEMVDAWHFFLNMMLAIGSWSGASPEEVIHEFERYYREKNAKNLQRQVDGYDGVITKCPNCQRELSESNTRISLGGSPVYCQHSCYEAHWLQQEGERSNG